MAPTMMMRRQLGQKRQGQNSGDNNNNNNNNNGGIRRTNVFLLTLRWLAIVLFLISGSLVWKISHHHHDSSSSTWGHDLAVSDLPLDLLQQQARLLQFQHFKNFTTQLHDCNVKSKISHDENNHNSINNNNNNNKCQAEYDRLTRQYSHWTPGWTRDDLERSRALVGNRYRLAQLATKLATGSDPVLGVVCGGSISLGHGVIPIRMRYSDRLDFWMNDRYPLPNNQKHVVLNKGSHGADICAMAKRVNILLEGLPADPDLIILEFAVNDYQGQDHKIHLDHKTDVFFEGFEQLVVCAEIVVYKILSHYQNTAVVFLELQTAILNRKTAAVLHMGVAKHYQVPVISFAETVYPDFYRLLHYLRDYQYSTATIPNKNNATREEILLTGTADPVLPYPHGCVKCQPEYITPSFRDKGCKSLCTFAERSGEKGLHCPAPLLPKGREPCYVSFLAHDAIHLSAVGHQMATDLIAHAIASTQQDICQGQNYQDHILPQVGLMVADPSILDQRSNFILVKDTMNVFAAQDPLQANNQSAGFSLFGDSVDRPGWIASNPEGGEFVEFSINLPFKPCYAVYLAVLKSYEQMGTFNVTVTDLVTNQQTSQFIDGQWKPRISVPSDLQITSDDSAGCTGRCRVKIITHPQIAGRTGNKVKITTLSARECLQSSSSSLQGKFE